MIAPFNRVTFPLLKVIKSCTGTGLVSGLLVLCMANTNPPMLTMHTWADRRPWAGQVGVSATRSREAGPHSRPDLHWGSSSPGGWDGAAAARLCHIPRQEPCCTAPLFAVMSGTAWDGVGRAARAEASQKCFLHMFGTCRACHLPSAQTFWSWMPECASGRRRLLSCRELKGCRDFSDINSPLALCSSWLS